jgi:hypothetical protein
VQQHQLLAASDYDAHYAPLADAEEAGGGGRAARRWRPGDGRWQMAMGAFRYVWPSAGLLRVRLLACFTLVMVERGINLAVPILFKNMVESLSQTGAVTAAAEALLAAGGWARAQPGASGVVSAAGAAPGGGNAAAAAAGDGDGGGGGGGLPFWAAFYPWAFYYLGTLFLRGGAGGEGLLADVRDILWIPITQARGALAGQGVERGQLAWGAAAAPSSSVVAAPVAAASARPAPLHPTHNRAPAGRLPAHQPGRVWPPAGARSALALASQDGAGHAHPGPGHDQHPGARRLPPARAAFAFARLWQRGSPWMSIACPPQRPTPPPHPTPPHRPPPQDTVSIMLFSVLPSMIDILVACSYLAGR